MGKQQEIPGTEEPKIPEVEHAAESYREIRDERMELTESEITAKATLLAVMKKHNLKAYKDKVAGYVVLVEAGEDNVKVKKLQPDGSVKPMRTKKEESDEDAAKALAG
jgi:hypothetical protein